MGKLSVPRRRLVLSGLVVDQTTVVLTVQPLFVADSGKDDDGRSRAQGL